MKQISNSFWSIWLEGGRKDLTVLITKKQQREEKREAKKLKKITREA